jgi:hypothetical protein
MAAAGIHLSSPHLAEFKETLEKEGLVTKPFDLLVLKSIGGYAERL